MRMGLIQAYLMRSNTMIICICNNISDKQIRRAAEGGSRTMADLHRELNIGAVCGKCVKYAKEVLSAYTSDTPFLAIELHRVMAGSPA